MMLRMESFSLRRRACGLIAMLFAIQLVCAMDPHPALAESKKGGHAKSAEKSESAGEKKKPRRRKKKVEKPLDEHVIGSDAPPTAGHFTAEAAATAKVDVVIVIDASRSMVRTDPQRLRDQGAKLLMRFLGDGDRVAVVQFAEEGTTVIPFTAVTPTELIRIDGAISGIIAEGNFTNIQAGIQAGYGLFHSDARSDAKKVMILLSDGKMDPQPDHGTPAELTERVRATDLPKLREDKIALYTVALSGEADKELLESFAKEAEGQHWFSPDANTIHRKFSELFLSIKKPQVTPLEGGGFDIDSTVQEATFYVTREQGSPSVALVDPKGETIDSTHLPPNVKWFSGELFDVITIQRPNPGRWGVKGLENPEGFATLLSDLKLQVRWPQPTLNIGDSVAAYARLTNEGHTVSKPGLEDIVFFTYKIVSADDGSVLASGQMNDKGEHGDEKPKDDIYSTTIKVDGEGDYLALFAATSPTFTRQQRIPFTVSRGLVNLKKVEADEFAGTKESLKIELSSQVDELRQVKLQLVAKKEGQEKPFGISIPVPREEKVVDVPVDRLKPGTYELSARLTAVDTKKKPVSASSETVHYVVPGEDTGPQEEVEEIAEEAHAEEHPAPQSEGYLVWGIISLLLSAGAVGGIYVFGLKQIATTASKVEERSPYEVPDDVVARLENIRSSVSAERRPAEDHDREIFAAVADALG